MISVVDAQREVLLNPVGTNVWSGQVVQGLNSAAVTWSLAKELYGPSGPYFLIPLSLVIGMVPTTIQWLISRVSCAQCVVVFLYLIYCTALAYNRTSESRYDLTSGHIYGEDGFTVHFPRLLNSYSTVFRVLDCWCQLNYPFLDYRWSGLASMAASILPWMVQKVQLYPWWCTGWRCAGHDLHPVVRCLWCFWKTAAIPFLGWQSISRQCRLL